MQNIELLFDMNAAKYVLACYMKEPHLLIDDNKYMSTVDDFQKEVYQYIFGAIFNIAHNGVNSITPQDIDIYLVNYQKQYLIYNKAGGIDLINNIYKLIDEVDMNKFIMHYNRLKKFSLLRDYEKNGLDTKSIYDVNIDFLLIDKQEDRFNQLTVEDIIETVRKRMKLIEIKSNTVTATKAQKASENIDELLKELESRPEVGIELEGSILNYATRGARKGKMYLYSAPSGMGKSRVMVGEACTISLPYIKGNKVIVPKDLKPILFIPTEMQADEIQTLILSWISGINEEKILLFNLTEEEKKTLNLAVKILKLYKNNFIIANLSDVSIRNIKTLITGYILHDEVEYVFFDYIGSAVGLMEEFRDINLREDRQ